MTHRPLLEDDLKQLSEAHGQKALARAFAALQGAIRTTRKATAQKWGPLAATFWEAMRHWDAQKADGVSKVEREAGLEKTLRASWPQTREWKYLCSCNDVGLQMSECAGDATCGRKHPHQPHAFGTPCWCSAGARFRPKVNAPDDFQAAGKSLRPTRVGR